MNFPLELIDLIHNKINLRVLVKISLEIFKKDTFYQLNKKRLQNYWKKQSAHSLIKNNDLQGIKYVSKLWGYTRENIRLYDLILWSSKYGHLEMLKYVSIYYAKDLTNDIYSIALKCASHNGYLDVVKYLVEEKNASVSHKDNAAIKAASRCGHLEVFKYLREKGADDSAGDSTPILNAYKYGHLHLVKYFIQELKIILADAMNVACRCGYLKIVKYLVSCKNENPNDFSINLGCGYDTSSLETAIVYGKLKIVKYLVKIGIDIKQIIEKNCIETISTYFHMIKYLVDQGAKLGQVKTILLNICRNGKIEQLKYLVKKGADIKAHIILCLNTAINSNNLEVAKYLEFYLKNILQMKEAKC
jgi:ankyrin repeat protein